MENPHPGHPSDISRGREVSCPLPVSGPLSEILTCTRMKQHSAREAVSVGAYPKWMALYLNLPSCVRLIGDEIIREGRHPSPQPLGDSDTKKLNSPLGGATAQLSGCNHPKFSPKRKTTSSPVYSVCSPSAESTGAQTQVRASLLFVPHRRLRSGVNLKVSVDSISVCAK